MSGKLSLIFSKELLASSVGKDFNRNFSLHMALTTFVEISVLIRKMSQKASDMCKFAGVRSDGVRPFQDILSSGELMNIQARFRLFEKALFPHFMHFDNGGYFNS